MEARIKELFEEARSTQAHFIESERTMESMKAAARIMIECLKAGRKILLCGNGGSAADCQHIAGEIVGRFRRERSAWGAVALTTDTSVITAIGNDYSYADIFKRQVEGLGAAGDVLICYSTSGNSENVLLAIGEAKHKGMKTIALTGTGGGKMKGAVDVHIEAAAEATARAQECHLLAGHVLCELVEAAMTE
jgi:D-sedoheptulose 7-phosphate isomerase